MASPSTSPSPAAAAPGTHRLAIIRQARQNVLFGTAHAAGLLAEPWIERSWRRCLAEGHRPEQRLSFNVVSTPVLRRTRDGNRQLVQAARPVLEKLGQAIAGSRYFAILTNQHGVVVDVHGDIDRSDRRADVITRIGVDLSERQVGTTAISAALTELHPVWLHRGEHFFNDTSAYSCAGAPLFDPDGTCIGMLDLTGVDAAERPELRHLVTQSARHLENALTLARPWRLLLRLNWPGSAPCGHSDGLLCLDSDGNVTGANQAARQMLPQLAAVAGSGKVHSSELFALPFELLFDHATRQRHAQGEALQVPLWSGLRLQVSPELAGHPQAQAAARPRTAPPESGPRLLLKDIETNLIRRAVDDAKGNVLQAAKTLGISRATVYRRLGPGKRRPG